METRLAVAADDAAGRGLLESGDRDAATGAGRHAVTERPMRQPADSDWQRFCIQRLRRGGDGMLKVMFVVMGLLVIVILYYLISPALSYSHATQVTN